MLNGEYLSDCVGSYSPSVQPRGAVLGMIGGGTVQQPAPNREFAPIGLAPVAADLELQAVSQLDRDRLEAAWLESAILPAEVFVELTMLDLYAIPAGTKTTWTLSRSLPYSRVSESEFPVVAHIVDKSATGATETALEVISSGAPTLSQLAYDTAEPTQVTTGDLSAHSGKLLRVRYAPLRLFRFDDYQEDFSTANTADISIALAEHVPVRTYAGLDE